MSKFEKWKDAAPENFRACCSASLKEGDEAAEQFGSSCRGGLSPLLWRVPILLWAAAVGCWSAAAFWGPREKFLLYMTHWGLLLIFLESLFGIIVAVQKMRGNLAGSGARAARLPWCARAYWALYNTAVPVAFLVTLFYWGVLRAPGKKMNYAPDPVLDAMLHGANSALMLLELLLSAHPSRLLHVMQPLYFALAYWLFTLAYYAAGGLDPWGNAFIYPVLDWSQPTRTLAVAALTALFLALLHVLAVAASSARDCIASRRLQDKSGEYNDGFEV